MITDRVDVETLAAENDRLRAELDRTAEAYDALREEHRLFRSGDADGIAALLDAALVAATRRYGAAADHLTPLFGQIVVELADLEDCRQMADRRKGKYAGSSVTHADIVAAKLLRAMEQNVMKAAGTKVTPTSMTLG